MTRSRSPRPRPPGITLSVDMPPKPVAMNGISWDPRVQDTLKNVGKTRFLKSPVDFRTARLNRIQARDIVAIEQNKDSVVVYINDDHWRAPRRMNSRLFFGLRMQKPILRTTCRRKAARRCESSRTSTAATNFISTPRSAALGPSLLAMAGRGSSEQRIDVEPREVAHAQE